MYQSDKPALQHPSSLSGFAPSMLLKAKSPLHQRHGINQMTHCDSKNQGKKRLSFISPFISGAILPVGSWPDESRTAS
jgi:hypothetical protein